MKNIKLKDTVICRIDEWRDGNLSWYDGTVISKTAKGVDVIYLSGYRSRNDFVEWKDICAVVDMSMPWTKLPDALDVPFSGNFRINEECK